MKVTTSSFPLRRLGSCAFALLLPLVAAAGTDPDTLRVGCSGGRTGLATGNTITRAGALSAYVKPFHSEATFTFLRTDTVAADSVFAALERVRFRTVRFTEFGTMTCALELTDGEGRHAVTWVEGQPPAELAPVLAALERAFGEDRRLWP